jgi:acid phosphatase (class A)
MKLLQIIFFCLFLSGVSTTIAQSSQQKSLVYKSLSTDFDHYQKIGSISSKPRNESIDTARFPLKDFRRIAYLKLRTIYLNVPVATFKTKQFPANSSEQTQAEITFLLDLQAKRTPEIMAKTDSMANIYHDPFTANPYLEDYKRNLNSLFFVGRNLGTWFNPSNLPITSKVLQNVIQDATFYFFTLKSEYARPRPYQLSKEIKNPEAPGHSSYPSGHSSSSHVNAYLLAEIFPQLKEQFLGNAYDMAFSREIRGVHYPSDSQAGKEFGEQFVRELLKNPKFLADFAKMKNELKLKKHD